MPKRLIQYSRKQPARAIIMIISGLTILAGIFMFTTWYGPLEATPLFGGPITAFGLYFTAVLNVLLPIPALFGIYKRDHRWISYGALTMFNWYLFIALSRLFTFPYPGRLLWLPSLMVAFVMGILYLEQKDLLSKKIDIKSDEEIEGGDRG